MNKPARAWCFTINNHGGLPDIDDFPGARYLIYQEEMGDNGTPHLQGYVEFNAPVRMSRLRNALSSAIGVAHWERRAGTRDQARDYCRKGDSRLTGPYEFGDWNSGGAGNRTDLAAVKRMLDDGASDLQVADDHFGSWCRYRNSFAAYRALKRKTNDRQTLEVDVMCGPPGCGKTYRAQHILGPDRYEKEQGKWWQGYAYQTHVLFDEFKGDYPFLELLRVCDKQSSPQVETKGSSIQCAATRVIFTSNHPLSTWYGLGCSMEALLRRITRLWIFDPALNYPLVYTSLEYAQFERHCAAVKLQHRCTQHINAAARVYSEAPALYDYHVQKLEDAKPSGERAMAALNVIQARRVE